MLILGFGTKNYYYRETHYIYVKLLASEKYIIIWQVYWCMCPSITLMLRILHIDDNVNLHLAYQNFLIIIYHTMLWDSDHQRWRNSATICNEEISCRLCFCLSSNFFSTTKKYSWNPENKFNHAQNTHSSKEAQVTTYQWRKIEMYLT